MLVSDAIGLAGHALFWGAALAALARRQPRAASWLAAASWRVWLLPLLVLASGWSWYARGVFSDIGIVGMALSCCWLIRREVRLPRGLLAGWVLIGGLLYASALGIVAPDVYSAGFNPQVLLMLAVGWVVVNGVANPLMGWILAAALVAYAGRLQTSVNLWDYLIDPLTWLALVGMAVRSGLGSLRKQ